MPPNVIFFQPDDLPFYDDYVGQPTGTPNSPNRKVPRPSSGFPSYESIFETGVAFSNANVVSPACGTSRYATLTGRYPSRSESGRTKTLNNDSSETRTQTTIPFTKLMDSDSEQNVVQLFKSAGYRTGVAGKWHLTKSGGGSAALPSYAEQQDEIKETGFDYADGIYWENMGGVFTGDFTHNHEWVTSKAIEFITDAADADQPFFLYFNPSVPHSPLVSDALENGNCLETPAGLLSTEPQVKHMTIDATTNEAMSCNAYRQTVIDRQDATQTSVQEQNLGGIWIDDSLSAMLSVLSDKNIKDDTIIITMMDHGIITKMALFENGNRVHLSMRYPKLGEYAENLIYDGYVTHLDVVATLLDICEISTTSYSMDGESFLPDLQRVISSRTSNVDLALYPSSADWSGSNRCVFAEYEFDRSVRCGCYKLLDISLLPRGSLTTSTTMSRGSQNGYSTYNRQMYNVCTDDGESSNLLDANGAAVDSTDEEMLNGLLRALQCHDDRTAPGAEMSFVSCGLSGQEDPTPCLGTNSGNCLSASNAGVACCDADESCERRDASYGQCKHACPYGNDPKWECENVAPTPAPTLRQTENPTRSPTQSPTPGLPTTNPTIRPTMRPTNSSAIQDKEMFWDDIDLDSPVVLAGAGLAILIFVICCICCLRRCCSSETKGAKSNKKAAGGLEMKRVGSNLL